MMNALRRHTKIILWVVVIAFVFTIFFVWGMDVGRRSEYIETQSAAVVNDQPIPYEDFGRMWDQRYRQIYGEQENEPTPAEIQQLRENVIQEMIDNQLLQQAAQKLGLRVFNDEVAAQIASLPMFQENGRFSQEKYINLLSLNRISPEEFEAEQKITLLRFKIRRWLMDSIVISEADVRDYQHARSRKLKLQYVRFNWQDELSRAAISEEQIHNYYQEHEKDYDQPEEVQAAHILIAVNPEASEEEKLTAKLKLENLRNEILKGKSFSEMAKAYSDDPGSKGKGGDLGFFRRGMMIKPFEDAAFKLRPGEISDLVETSFGYHLLQVIDRHAAKKSSYAEVRNKIKKQLQTEAARQLAREAALQFGKILLSNKNLASAAQQTKTRLFTSPWVKEGDTLASVEKEDNQTFFDYVFDLPWQTPSSHWLIGDSIYYAQIIAEQYLPWNENLYALEKDRLLDKLKDIRGQQAIEDWLLQARQDAKIINNIKKERLSQDLGAQSTPLPTPQSASPLASPQP